MFFIFQGEIIHIDLGVAFEQGRILPTPETIPFRLTRDIVDGFGPTGVEGVFRQCCEHSLRVLRDNSAAVLTVLEVLLEDRDAPHARVAAPGPREDALPAEDLEGDALRPTL